MLENIKTLKALYTKAIKREEAAKAARLAQANTVYEINAAINTAEQAKAETAGRFAEIVKNCLYLGEYTKREKAEALDWLTVLEAKELTGLALYTGEDLEDAED